LIVVVCASGIARADIDIAKSDAAFEEGLKLKDAGQLDKACAKFREALVFNPNAVGTMLNVAVCDENTGHIASAYKRFKEARDRGHEQNLGEQAKLAEDHMAKLEPDMPYLAIAFAEATDDTKLVVNDEVIALKEAGNIPVDPGPLSIVVSRPGRVPYETKTAIDKKEHKAVAVPKLGLPVTVSSGKRRVGQVATFGGGAIAVTGLVIGLVARSHWNKEFDNGNCMRNPGASPTCNETGYNNTSNAYFLGNVGTAVGIGGVVIAGVGAYLWWSSPHDEKAPAAPVSIVPDLDPQHVGLAAVGRF
jgi:hypothetical protein